MNCGISKLSYVLDVIFNFCIAFKPGESILAMATELYHVCLCIYVSHTIPPILLVKLKLSDVTKRKLLIVQHIQSALQISKVRKQQKMN